MRKFIVFLSLLLMPVAFWPESPVLQVQAAKKTKAKKRTVRSSAKSKAGSRRTAARKRAVAKRRSTTRPTRTARRSYSPWTTPTYAESTHGDRVEDEDLEVRRAAVEALGPFNGSVVVTDPTTGRILTIVNQKLALSPGYQPCSTIKVPVAMAGLQEGLIERDTKIQIFRRSYLDLTHALAKSNNPYFAILGQKLGFEKVSEYCRRFGLGEKATLLPDERPGTLPKEPPPSRVGGVGKMTSFGEGISLSPVQLAGFLGAIANGGTLYYLQYPKGGEDGEFAPKIKRRLEIEPHLDHMMPGMLGTTEFGTGRRARYSYTEPIFGKTGTCTEGTTHLGWFGSFNKVNDQSLVVVVLLTGGRPSVGPMAAHIAGKVYKNLETTEYFARERRSSPAAMVQSPVRLAQ